MGITFARELDAKITVLQGVESATMLLVSVQLAETQKRCHQHVMERAARHLGEVQSNARAAEVSCETVHPPASSIGAVEDHHRPD